jgi:hypothetical protein
MAGAPFCGPSSLTSVLYRPGQSPRLMSPFLEFPNVHHDALEFPDGGTVLVTRLCEGQHATVLQLPASRHSVNDEVELKHAAVVG